jgi:PQQ-like domain
MPVELPGSPLAARAPTASAVSPAQGFTADGLQADGLWCPMAHGNRNVSSFQDLPPLLNVSKIQKIVSPAVSSRGFIHLGSFTGETMAVCAYASPRHPALVAYDYQDGSIRWRSALEELPAPGEVSGFQRLPAGVLLAKMSVNGKPTRHYVFAANPAEFVAYRTDGTLVWKRPTTAITTAAPYGVGGLTSLSFDDAKELVTTTTDGWVVKLNPVDGRVIDAYKMDTNVVVEGRIYRGTFTTFKSPVVIGNVLYLIGEFEADPSTPLPTPLKPVYLVRIDLCQPGVSGHEAKIKPLTRPENPRHETPDRLFIGVNRKLGGSPSGGVTPDGKVLIFANAETFVRGGLKPTITAVEDRQGVLKERWRSVLGALTGDGIHSAPALDVDRRTLLVTTLNNIFVFRNVDALAGRVPSPTPLAGGQLVNFGAAIRRSTVRVGSPFALTFDPDADELVIYTNFRVVPFAYRTYGFLGAFTVPARGRVVPRPLWHCPLALTAAGMPAPGPGTFGQPALFRYKRGSSEMTGIIVNTVFTGTYIIK